MQYEVKLRELERAVRDKYTKHIKTLKEREEQLKQEKNKLKEEVYNLQK
jgi:hypothetical protein